MAFCRLVLPFLVLTIVSTYGKVQVPVFLWGDISTSVKSNPLSTVSQEEFREILQKELQGDSFSVIFMDESLSVEDLSHRNADGETSFPFLHANIGKAVYLPAVAEPSSVLNNLADPEKVDHVKLTENGLSAEFVPQSGKILFITLKDASEGESRADMLRRHNDFMEQMFTKLQDEYESVVAVYTANNPSWIVSERHSRVRRQTVNSSDEDTEHSFEGLKLYVNRLVLTVGETETNLTTLESSSSVINSTEMSTTLNYGNDALTLNFLKKMGYWYFSSVILKQGEVTTALEPESDVFAPVGFSYRCGQNVTFANDTYSLLFQNIKVQPFFVENGNSSLVFGDSINCVGFFTVPIWSGIFVVAILLSITFYGVMMMMDIRTMDRFDDPKGKTITINAGD